MLNDILVWFTKQFADFFIFFINLISTPLIKLLERVIPNFSSILFYANEVLTQFFMVGAQFAKMIFCNLLNINHNVFTFACCCFGLRILIFFGLRTVRFALNLWGTYKSARTGGD